jgi:tripartite-type tricarboxylate transporter receptor subunit TctC
MISKYFLWAAPLAFTLLGETVLLPHTVFAQETYPNRPITLVVPFPPGGMADLSARPLAVALEKQLGQPMVVLNRPGAAGATGIQYAASQKPDGYTLMVTLVSFSTIPEVDAIFKRTPAYTRDQFEPIALLAADPPVLAVSASSPWKTLKDLVDDAKAKPGTILYSHSGLYGPSHLPMEIFLHAAGIKMRQVPAVGGGPAMTMVLGGNAAMWASPPGMAVPHVEAGKLRILASWGATRHPAFPDVPTLKELGYNVENYVWSGVFAPKGVPAPIMATLQKAIAGAVKAPEFVTAMDKIKVPIAYLDAAAFKAFIEKDAQTLTEAIRNIGVIQDAK